MNILKKKIRIIAITGIRIYQRSISPLLPQSCRFYPSCSEYAAQAIEKYGLWRGAVLSARRLSRCHPWHEGGFDPVDETKT
ncbi:MAG: membrane protein insertion efficiency factor YidD [Candidatus Latescibacteria bacterium]|nr:membrane protein insertion efficiency factor YidD [Candidatus Latescibacterota bacterium]NIM22660.1 membrane protein insertion efficiency factor YidD [Candidatus Latescibacterota bacterium]NIM64949.1 membrane protein insertion efficiency factor YidD [Candidatus Latescibacterota bacterium]NIO01464.1 membrane protein insertion efficiency factor YidD [Candidatus Latescibacterota bacterium]NIO27974.1 membrane protein insertion efficiency factor YidD [Candidatus Latescibacterota bacterium]